MSSKLVASAIRKELKALYPNVKFSVVMSSYSAVRIKYSFGVSEKEIQSLCSKYEMGYFDGMDDMYHYSNRNDSIPQCQYVFVERSETWNELQKLAKYVSKTFNVEFNSNVRNMIGYRWLNCLNDIELIENEDVETMYNRVRKEAIRQGLLCVCDDVEPLVEPSSVTEVKQEVETSSDTEVKTSKWDKLNKEFDEKMSSMSDDEFSNWIDNNEVKMSVENVVEKMIESSNAIGCDIEDDIQADEIVSNTQEIVEVQVKCPSCHCRYNVYNFGDTSFKCERCGATHKLDVDGFTIVESINKIKPDEIKVLNITDENVKISNEKYNTIITYTVEKPINIEEYKNGYMINGSSDRYVVIEKLSETKLNRFVKEIIKSQMENMKDSRCVIFKNFIQCFTECGRMIEVFENIVSQKHFIEIMENEKVEIDDILYLTDDGVIIQSPKRNCIILL